MNNSIMGISRACQSHSSTLYGMCNIKPGDMEGNVTETRNTVVFIGSLMIN